MTDNRQGAAAPASEADTAQPNPPEKQSGGWEMPEPKFQHTSGYLPQGYLDQAGLAAAPEPARAMSPVTSPDVEVPAAAVAVEPQPDLDISEPSLGPAVAPAAPAKQRSTGARVVMILLGVAGMVAFIAVFLAVIYYLFIRPANGGGPF